VLNSHLWTAVKRVTITLVNCSRVCLNCTSSAGDLFTHLKCQRLTVLTIPVAKLSSQGWDFDDSIPLVLNSEWSTEPVPNHGICETMQLVRPWLPGHKSEVGQRGTAFKLTKHFYLCCPAIFAGNLRPSVKLAVPHNIKWLEPRQTELDVGKSKCPTKSSTWQFSLHKSRRLHNPTILLFHCP